jgi:hypothetical protein
MQKLAPGLIGDFLIALVLLLGSVGLLLVTDQAGFTRDESFYFDNAEAYQNWMVRVQAGGEERKKALQRDELLQTWRQNSEHPPLDKWLFGFSWRLFGRKLRAVTPPERRGQELRMDITGLGPAHGFAQGASVLILAPQQVGSSASVRGRWITDATVVERDEHRATVRLPIGVQVDKLQRQCLLPGPAQSGAIMRTGCEAVERQTLYFLTESQAMRLPNMFFAGLLVATLYLATRMWFASRATAAGRGRVLRPFALMAALGYLALPQPFWHAHLCTFDTTIAALMLLTTVTWHHSLSAVAWIWPTAILWGLCLLTKHNALLLPIPLLAHWVWHSAREGRIRWSGPTTARLRWQWLGGALVAAVIGAVALKPLVGMGLGLAVLAVRFRVYLPPVPSVFFAMLIAGPLVLVAGWPLLWTDTLDNLSRWIEFHLHHEHYMQVYFGQVLAYPPFPAAFAWVMTALTWPLTLLVAAILGFVVVAWPRRAPPTSVDLAAKQMEPERQLFNTWMQTDVEDSLGRTTEQRSMDRLLLLSALWPMALISVPGTPIFGGTKHWMLAFPFMLWLGARGLQAIWMRVFVPLDPDLDPNGGATAGQGVLDPLASLRDPTLAPRALGVSGLPWWRRQLVPGVAAWVLAVVMLIPAVVATARVHPHGSAYFNELIGGVPGAAEAGMQRQFWGGTTREGLEEINRRTPAGSSVWFHKSTWGSFAMYQKEGWLRRDLRYGTWPTGTKTGLYHHQKDHDDYELDAQRDYGTPIPVFQAARDGVPLLSVYARP